MTLVLDAGALIAVDRRDREVFAALRVAQRHQTPVVTSGAVAAQVWRDGARQANLARGLAGVDDRALDRAAGATVGELLRACASSDMVDAHVAVIANAGDSVWTSDPEDIGRLLVARGVEASIVRV